MENNEVLLQIAKDLTVVAFQTGNFKIAYPENEENPETVGKTVAKFFKSVLDELSSSVN